jgi:hypothetical protein
MVWRGQPAKTGANGSAGRVRTYDHPINSRMLYH